MGGVREKVIISVFLTAERIVLSVVFSHITSMISILSFLAVFIHILKYEYKSVKHGLNLLFKLKTT